MEVKNGFIITIQKLKRTKSSNTTSRIGRIPISIKMSTITSVSRWEDGTLVTIPGKEFLIDADYQEVLDAVMLDGQPPINIPTMWTITGETNLPAETLTYLPKTNKAK